MHTTHITHTWGEVQLQRVAWDLYVRIPTFVGLEMSNNRFTIPKPIFPIESKWRVTYYTKVTWKEKQTSPTTATINQTNKCALMSLKVYTSMVSIWGSCLKLLWVVLVFHLHLYLLWQGYCLEVTLVSISISTSSTMFAYSIPPRYVHKFYMMCLYV